MSGVFNFKYDFFIAGPSILSVIEDGGGDDCGTSDVGRRRHGSHNIGRLVGQRALVRR